MDFALILLGFLEGELDAEVESTGSEPVLIQLEDLQVELAIDGSDVTVRRMSGSAGEFGDLCDLIVSQYSLS